MLDNQTVRITPRAADYSEWYLDVIRAAGLSSYSDVPGCMIVEPNGTALWEMIRNAFDARIKATGHRNVMYPALIPQSLIDKEAKHIGGFAPELAKIERLHGEALADPLCLRPTSETLIYSDWAKKITSIADLPILINQWGNVFRAERRTRPFLRSWEFFWQEGHTAHADEHSARDETMRMLEEYRNFIENTLAIPTIPGRKTLSERFAGAEDTFTIEAMMQDGKALQSATSHYIGTGFPSAYGIRFQSGKNEWLPVHATSWGMSTRIIGAIVMVHSDDAGLVLPPRIAPTQVAILTIRDSRTAAMPDYDASIGAMVVRLQSAGVRVEVDDADQRIGQKHYKHEKSGVPIRIVLGAQELKAQTATITRRDTSEKQSLALDAIDIGITATLNEMQSDMFERARSRLANKTLLVKDMSDVSKAVETSNWFFVGGWCGKAEKEAELKELHGLTIRCIPSRRLTDEKRCFMTGETAVEQVVVAKAY